jgi:predicted acetyltransferase
MDFGPMQEGDLTALMEILGEAFAHPAEDAAPWLALGGHANVRVLREAERPVGCLLLVPMGHFMLGRSVPTMGIAGVGTTLDRRGQGVARRLVEASIREIAERGVALSTLYPATQTLYRHAGYERAGKMIEVRIPVENLAPRPMLPPAGPGAIEMRRLGDADMPGVHALYAQVAATQHGYLDRGPYVWTRVRQTRDKKVVRGFGFFAGDVLEGYLFMRQNPSDDPPLHHDVWLTDVCFDSPRALRAMLTFLSSQRSLAWSVTFRTGVHQALSSALGENRYDEELVLDWMVRITHVESALALRGYPEHVTATLELDVRDDLVPQNAGRWTLHVQGGRGEVSRGGAGRLAIDVRALAPLYTGYHAPAELARLGWLDARAEDAAIARSVFTSPMPGMADMF